MGSSSICTIIPPACPFARHHVGALLQPALVSIIASCCICSKSAAKLLLQVVEASGASARDRGGQSRDRRRCCAAVERNRKNYKMLIGQFLGDPKEARDGDLRLPVSGNRCTGLRALYGALESPPGRSVPRFCRRPGRRTGARCRMRHRVITIALAERGCTAVGVDASEPYLEGAPGPIPSEDRLLARRRSSHAICECVFRCMRLGPRPRRYPGGRSGRA